MKKIYLLLLAFYLIFALGVDFSVVKRRAFLADEASHLLSLLCLSRYGSLEVKEEAVEQLHRYYFFATSNLFLVKRDRVYSYSPWVYSYLTYPLFRLAGERGLYLFNFLLLSGVFLLASLIEKQYHTPSFFLFLLASVSWIYFFLEGPYLLQFALAMLALYLFMKNKFVFASYVMGVLAFLNPLVLFLLPLFAFIAFRKKPFSGIFFIFKSYLIAFLLVAAGLVLGGSLPWDKPVLLSGMKEITAFLQQPAPAQAVEGGSFLLNIIYFLFGRFSGLFLYYPLLFFLPFWLRRRELPFLLLSIALLGGYVFFQAENFSPLFFLGNPLMVGLYPFFYYFLSRSYRPLPLILSILLLSYFSIMPLRNLINPLMHAQIFPYNIMPVEVVAYDRLPLLRAGTNLHLDSNFYHYSGPSFWTRGSGRVEFIRLSKSNHLSFVITNSKVANRVKVRVNGLRKEMALRPGAKLRFLARSHLRVGNNWVFHVIVKSERCEVKLPEKVALGVKVEAREVE